MWTEWAVHTAVLYKNFSSQICQVWDVTLSVLSSSRTDPGRGQQEEVLGSVCAPCCLHVTTDRSHTGGSCSRRWGFFHKLPLRLFSDAMTLDCWWNHSGALGFVLWKQQPFLSWVEVTSGCWGRAFRSVFCWSCIRMLGLLPLTNGNKTDKSP